MAETMSFLSILSFITLFSPAFSYDVNQDFCVADFASPLVEDLPNGLPCKSIQTVTADDFSRPGLDVSGNTNNPFGASLETAAADSTVPGLNTMGMTLARLDFQLDGFIPPHVHPKATEVITVLEGSMEVGFVTSSPYYKHFSKVLQKGDVFVIPMGLLHYHRQVGPVNASAITVSNSQNPGILTITNEMFVSTPLIDLDFLATVLSLDKATVENIREHYPGSTRIL